MNHLLRCYSCPASPPGQETCVTACPRLVSLSLVYSFALRPLRGKPTRTRLSNLDCRASMPDRSFFLRHRITLVYCLDPGDRTRKTISSHLIVTRAGQVRCSRNMDRTRTVQYAIRNRSSPTSTPSSQTVAITPLLSRPPYYSLSPPSRYS